MEEERDAIQAIYDSDFSELVNAAGRPLWRFRLADHGVAVSIVLPECYPDCSDPPEPSIEFDTWPAGGDAFVARMFKELQAQWTSGEGCAFTWIEHVKEALASDAPSAADATPATDAGVAPAEEPRSVPVDVALAGQVGPSLEAAGFAACGSGIFSHGDAGVTVEVGDELSITVDGIDAEDLVDWSSMQLQADVSVFGARLVEWVTAQRSAEPGFIEGDGEDDGPAGLDHLPSAADVGATRNRQLHIYTWGKALRKSAPPDSEHNFNAGILNGRGGGADLRTMNGLSEEVQNNVACCGLFPRWISMVCAKVEHSDLKCISINCTKGRHRSVAAAEILRQIYYPDATMKHLTIY